MRRFLDNAAMMMTDRRGQEADSGETMNARINTDMPKLSDGYFKH